MSARAPAHNRRYNKGSSSNAVTLLSAALRPMVGEGGRPLDPAEAKLAAEVQVQAVERLGLWGYAPYDAEAVLQVNQAVCTPGGCACTAWGGGL